MSAVLLILLITIAAVLGGMVLGRLETVTGVLLILVLVCVLLVTGGAQIGFGG
jgi:hypothetical protein